MLLTRMLGLPTVGGMLCVVAAGVTLVVLLGARDTFRDKPSVSPHESFLHLATDTTAVPGGEWTFEDKKTPFSMSEAFKDERQECLPDPTTEQYTLTLFGPATSHPARAVETMTQHWQGLGYKVRVVTETSDDTEITATVPGGSYISYYASTDLTAVTAEGPCVKSAN